MKSPYTPQPGDYVKPDGWKIGEILAEETLAFKDASFPGCQFRLKASCGTRLAVNIKVTGQDYWVEPWGSRQRCRCQVEFVGDGEPSTTTVGWLYHG